MQLTKQANGKQGLKITRQEWSALGQQAGWLEKEAGLGDMWQGVKNQWNIQRSVGQVEKQLNQYFSQVAQLQKSFAGLKGIKVGDKTLEAYLPGLAGLDSQMVAFEQALDQVRKEATQLKSGAQRGIVADPQTAPASQAETETQPTAPQAETETPAPPAAQARTKTLGDPPALKRMLEEKVSNPTPKLRPAVLPSSATPTPVATEEAPPTVAAPAEVAAEVADETMTHDFKKTLLEVLSNPQFDEFINQIKSNPEAGKWTRQIGYVKNGLQNVLAPTDGKPAVKEPAGMESGKHVAAGSVVQMQKQAIDLSAEMDLPFGYNTEGKIITLAEVVNNKLELLDKDKLVWGHLTATAGWFGKDKQAPPVPPDSNPTLVNLGPGSKQPGPAKNALIWEGPDKQVRDGHGQTYGAFPTLAAAEKALNSDRNMVYPGTGLGWAGERAGQVPSMVARPRRF